MPLSRWSKPFLADGGHSAARKWLGGGHVKARHLAVLALVAAVALAGCSKRGSKGGTQANKPITLNGSLADLSNYAFENKDSWLTALKDAGTYNGKLYGVPYYAGSRVVWFNQDMWKAAGLPDPTASPPATLADLQKDAQKIMAKVNKPDFSGLYFPGKYWYGAISFVYDTGGSIATSDSSGKWTGNLNSAQSQQGLNNWLNFVKAVSKAPANGDETKDTDI